MQNPQTKSKSQWQSQFDTWSQGPSDTETQRCENAERMVREAIKAFPNLKDKDIEVFAQGSYRNRTNIRMESDVDVCVLCNDTFFPDYTHTPGLNDAALGYKDASYRLDSFKNDVEAALKAKFGDASVKRGDKAVEIKENTYRVSADAVPAFEGRLFYKDSNGDHAITRGTVIQSDKTGKTTKNFPKQHIERGIAKHDRTSRRYKKRVRILKNLCCDMKDEGISSAAKMKSFLLESLVYNCPDDVFNEQDHYNGMKAIVLHLWNLLKDDTKAASMMEANAVKYLFHSDQPWNKEEVKQFLVDVWNYAGFSD